MKTTIEYCDEDKAIKILRKIKKDNKAGKKRGVVICTINFDEDTEIRKVANPEEGCILVKNSKTIILNNDNFFPHMELYSIIQDINNIRKRGIMHDIIFFSG